MAKQTVMHRRNLANLNLLTKSLKVREMLHPLHPTLAAPLYAWNDKRQHNNQLYERSEGRPLSSKMKEVVVVVV